MNIEPGSSETSPESDFIEVQMELLMPAAVEASIVRAIVEGTGGPENQEMTDPGLRFVRHLLSVSRNARHGFIPNFKDMNIVRQTARQFIQRCGGYALAMQTMIRIAHYESA